MIFSLVQDFADVLDSMPADHPRHRILKLLDEAIRRDVHFIDRHSTTFFQCLWNSCWWYDCPEAADHGAPPIQTVKQPPPDGSDQKSICRLAESWQRIKAATTPDFCWIRSSRPPEYALGTGLLMEFRCREPVGLALFGKTGDTVICVSRLDHGDSQLTIFDAATGGSRARFPFADGAPRLHSTELKQNWADWLGECDPLSIPEVLTRLALPANYIDAFETLSATSLQTNRRAAAEGPGLVRLSANDHVAANSVLLRDEPESIFNLNFSPDGHYLLCSYQNGVVSIWDVNKLEKKYRWRTEPAYSLAMSPDHQRMALGLTSGEICICNAETGEEQLRFPAHRDRVRSVAFSPCGSILLSASTDRSAKMWRVGDLRTLNAATSPMEDVLDLVLSRDGSRVGTYDGNQMEIWDVEHGTRTHAMRLTSEFHQLVELGLSPRGDFVVSRWSGMRRSQFTCVTELATGREIIRREWEMPPLPPPSPGRPAAMAVTFGRSPSSRIGLGSTTHFPVAKPQPRRWSAFAAALQFAGDFRLRAPITWAFDPDGRRLVIAARDLLEDWSVEDPTTPVRFEGCSGKIACVDWSRDGGLVAAATDEQKLYVWDTTTHAAPRSVMTHDRGILSICLAPDNVRCATLNVDGTIQVMSLTGEVLHRFEIKEPAGENRIGFTQDGRQLVCGSPYDFGVFHTWDLASGDKLRTIHAGPAIYFGDQGTWWRADIENRGQWVTWEGRGNPWAMARGSPFAIMLADYGDQMPDSLQPHSEGAVYSSSLDKEVAWCPMPALMEWGGSGGTHPLAPIAALEGGRTWVIAHGRAVYILRLVGGPDT